MSSPPTRRKRPTGEGRDKNTKNIYWRIYLREKFHNVVPQRITTTKTTIVNVIIYLP